MSILGWWFRSLIDPIAFTASANISGNEPGTYDGKTWAPILKKYCEIPNLLQLNGKYFNLGATAESLTHTKIDFNELNFAGIGIVNWVPAVANEKFFLNKSPISYIDNFYNLD